MNETRFQWVGAAMRLLQYSARACHRIRKPACTITHLAAHDRIEHDHIAETIQYRLRQRR
ncbi:MAG: hypothetical protein J5I90_10605 [Caldilineales bacterium]|nr:hypothetical protein [Caldilineales bacterium]